MPEKETLERAERDKRQGKSPSTQAGEFVREEMHHVREGKHGAASTKQAIAIGLSKARRAGVDLPAPRIGSARTKKQAARERQADDGQKLDGDQREENAQHHRAGDAEEDDLAADGGIDAGGGEADHHGIVAREHDVDEENLEKGRQLGGQKVAHGFDTPS